MLIEVLNLIKGILVVSIASITNANYSIVVKILVLGREVYFTA